MFVFSDHSRSCLQINNSHALMKDVDLRILGTISYGNRSSLILIGGNMIAQCYIDEVVKLHFYQPNPNPIFQRAGIAGT